MRLCHTSCYYLLVSPATVYSVEMSGHNITLEALCVGGCFPRIAAGSSLTFPKLLNGISSLVFNATDFTRKQVQIK